MLYLSWWTYTLWQFLRKDVPVLLNECFQVFPVLFRNTVENLSFSFFNRYKIFLWPRLFIYMPLLSFCDTVGNSNFFSRPWNLFHRLLSPLFGSSFALTIAKKTGVSFLANFCSWRAEIICLAISSWDRSCLLIGIAPFVVWVLLSSVFWDWICILGLSSWSWVDWQEFIPVLL